MAATVVIQLGGSIFSFNFFFFTLNYVSLIMDMFKLDKYDHLSKSVKKKKVF